MTGIDVADVNRIERLLKYNPTFLDSLFCAEKGVSCFKGQQSRNDSGVFEP